MKSISTALIALTFAFGLGACSHKKKCGEGGCKAKMEKKACCDAKAKEAKMKEKAEKAVEEKKAE